MAAVAASASRFDGDDEQERVLKLPASLEDVAGYLDLSKRALWQHMVRHGLPYLRCGRAKVLNRAQFNKLVETMTATAAAGARPDEDDDLDGGMTEEQAIDQVRARLQSGGARRGRRSPKLATPV